MPELPVLPPIADQPLSVVLLARQAGEHVDSLLTRWTAHLDTLGRPWELFVADDASTDRTVEKALRHARAGRVEVLGREAGPAEGLALRQALERCRHPLVYITRLLPRYQPADLGKMLVETRARRPDTNAACPEIDLVHLTSGYRAGRPVPVAWAGLGLVWRALQGLVLGNQPTPLPGWLGFRRHLAGLFYRVLFGIRNRDAGCPARLLRRDILPRLALQSESSFVHVEILAKATFLGLILSEDIPLGERRRGTAPDPAAEYADEPGAVGRDFRRLFLRPDFGPAVLPEQRP